MSWLYKTVWPMRPIACTVTVQPKIWGLTLHGRLMKGAIFGLKTLAFCDHHCYQDHQWSHPGFKHDFVTRKCCSSDINKALDVNFKRRGNSLTSHILWDTLTSSLGRLSLLNIMAGPPIPPPKPNPVQKYHALWSGLVKAIGVSFTRGRLLNPYFVAGCRV